MKIENNGYFLLHQGPPNNFAFFGKYLKKTTQYFLKFLIYLKAQSIRLIMEYNFIQMAVSAGHAVDYTIG